MIQEVWTLLNERASFFLGLCGEHLAISLIAIIIAVLIGGALGIFLDERIPEKRSPGHAHRQFSVYDPVHFHAWVADPAFRHRQSDRRHRAHAVCAAADGQEHLYRTDDCQCRHHRSCRGHGQHWKADPVEDQAAAGYAHHPLRHPQHGRP